MEKLQFSTGDPVEEKDSMFQAFAIKVHSLEEIELAYMAVRQLKDYADHILLAYCLKNDEWFKEGGSSDRTLWRPADDPPY